ncbi:MAG: hypothetical protein GX606_06035, partial [Elusimicrobia bacterium]|nr:hypothetical protein [Elusimicrobiota bacterium]
DNRKYFKEKYEALQLKMEEYIKEQDAQRKASQEAYQRQLQAESNARAAAEMARRQSENDELVKRSNPLLYYRYQVLDPRLNTYSVGSASSDIVVTRDKLVAGQIEVTARLNHIEKAKALLVSVDGGRTWKEIPLATDVRYAFTPIPQQAYRIMFKIKTVDMIDVTLGLLDGPSAIVYQDAEFGQQVLQAVQSLADAYERQDFGTFSNMIARDFVGNKSTLEEGVRFDFDMFTDIQLKLYVDRIDQRGTMFVAETRWDKAQTPRKTGEVQKTTGKTTMMFVVEEGNLRLKNLKGNLLYATLSPDIAQSSGLKSTIVDQVRTARDDRNPTQPGSGTTEDEGGLSSQTEDMTITVTSPNGGENWGRGNMYMVTWTSTGISEVHIEYEEGPDNWFDIVAAAPAAAGSYSWTIDPMIGAVAASQVRITAVEDPTVSDTSDNTFSIF